METECGLTVYSYNASLKHLLAFRNASQYDRAKASATSKLEYCGTRTLPDKPLAVWPVITAAGPTTTQQRAHPEYTVASPLSFHFNH